MPRVMTTVETIPVSKTKSKKLVAYVEILVDHLGDWYYRAIAGNGDTLFVSNGYTEKHSAKRAVKKKYLNNAPA